MAVHERQPEIFKNPIQLVRPLTVDPTRRFERHVSDEAKLNESRPKTSGADGTKKSPEELESNSSSTNFSFASDEEYDTDIEDDPDQFRDHSCIGLYKRMCHNDQTVPVGEYLRHYNEKELSMHYYGLGPKGMRAFVPSLTMNQYVTKLDLASNGLGDKGVMYLSFILRDNTAIVDIDLSQNFIGIDGTRALCDMLKKDNITLNHLKLNGNLLDDECACLLGDLLTSTGQIHTLRLANNRFGPGCGASLGESLAENTTLELLDISWNSFGGKGAVALIKGIQKNVFHKRLNLSHNALAGAECGRAWFNAFKENTTLVELDLSYNRYTAEPATFIGRALARSESLQIVRLTGNPLESAGCYAILKPLIAKNAISHQLALIELTDKRSCLNSDFQDLLEQVKAQRPTLRVWTSSPDPSALSRKMQRPTRSPVERLHTLFLRRPQLDLTKFFLSVATEIDALADHRIQDPDKLKKAIRENLGAQFSDDDVNAILNHVAQFDCKKFIQTFDNKPITINSSSSWRFKR